MDTALRITAGCVAVILFSSVCSESRADDSAAAAATSSADVSVACAQDDAAALRHDIDLLNLVNGLYLTDDQVEELIRVARKAEGYRAVHRDVAEVATGEQLSKQLVALEKHVKRVMTVSQLQVIDEFKPRPVPAGNPKDPGRVEVDEKPAERVRLQSSSGKVGRYLLHPSIIGILEDRQQTDRALNRPEERPVEQTPGSQSPVRIEVGGEIRVRALWQE